MPRTTDGTPAGGARPRNRLEIARQALAEIENLAPGQEDDEGVHVHVHMPGATARTADAEPGAGGAGTRTLDAESEARISGIEDGMLELRQEFQTGLSRIEALLQQPGRTADGAQVVIVPPVAVPPAGDSAALHASFQQFVAQAEILVPGFRVPTFDSAVPRAKTVDAMCSGRRAVLTTLASTTDGAALLGRVCDEGFDVAGSDCASVSTVFKAAAALKGAANNRGTTGDRLTVPGGAQQVVVPSGGVRQLTADEINATNAKFWANQ